MKFVLIAVFACVLLQVQAGFFDGWPESNCKEHTDCQVAECCAVHSPFLMSKRNEVEELTLVRKYCQAYVKKDETCNPTGRNTCGCEAGTKCKRVDTDKDTPFPSRIVILGTWKCV